MADDDNNNGNEVVERLEVMRKARPWLRTAMAFIFFVTNGEKERDDSYVWADYFIHQLEKDLAEEDGDREE